MTEERIVELKKLIYEEQQQYAKLKEEIIFLSGPSMDETRIREMWSQMEQERAQKERDQIKHDQWLKDREEKKLELERQWRTQKTPLKIQKSISQDESTEPDTTSQPQTPTQSGTSPLLTSLLKSPSQAQQQQQSSSARSAPTITNLLTQNSIPQSSNILINNAPSQSSSAVIINSSISNLASSQSAPTLVNLLDKKSSLLQDASTSEKQQLMSVLPETTGGKDSDMVKDEEAELLADFNELIAEKFDDIDEDLEVLNSIIMNPEILEEKISDSEHPNKDIDDSSQATSTDDYDKLKIKQIAETIQDFAGNVDGSNLVQMETPKVEENSEVQEPESSAPTSIDIEPPMESNDSNITKEEQPDEANEKVVMISDESSNATDKKMEEQDTNDGESSVADEATKNDKDETLIESDENSMASEVKEVKDTSNFQIEDSGDAIFEDAKETLNEPEVKEATIEEKQLPEIQEPRKEEEHSRSAIDSEDEILQEVKTRRSKKAFESLKADTPSSSTRSRDHSENDDNRDSTTPIRTRSRHSSTAVSEPKFSFSKEQDHSMWKARWDDCAKELQKHKDFSQIIDNKMMQDDVYKRVCLHQVNLKIIAKNIENNISTLPADVKRDFSLMCTNFIMLNNNKSKSNEAIHQFTKECLDIIDSHMEVEDAYKSYRKQIKKKN